MAVHERLSRTKLLRIPKSKKKPEGRKSGETHESTTGGQEKKKKMTSLANDIRGKRKLVQKLSLGDRPCEKKERKGRQKKCAKEKLLRGVVSLKAAILQSSRKEQEGDPLDGRSKLKRKTWEAKRKEGKKNRPN